MDQVVLAEELGFDTAWLAEAHFYPEFSIMPSPLVMAAALAARTSRIRLGTAVSVVPLHHPLRLAEEMAMVDVISGGRFEAGVGRGKSSHHFTPLGVQLEDSRELLVEGLEVLRGAWTQTPFSYSSRFWEINDITLVPRPVQRPHPPLWLAATSERSMEFAAREGYPILLSSVTNSLPALYDFIVRYRKLADSAGNRDRASVAVVFWVHPYDDAATDEQVRHSLRTNLAVIHAPPEYTFELADQTMALFGDLRRVQARAIELLDGGVDELICWFNPGGQIPHETVCRAMRQFASNVFPVVAV
jgi:alkanesulfonate monooxygenase SsuD/methylene tetrahydromethanopterin reductase-like flavin-dependent oxidoreductase (luciferase family)